MLLGEGALIFSPLTSPTFETGFFLVINTAGQFENTAKTFTLVYSEASYLLYTLQNFFVTSCDELPTPGWATIIERGKSFGV